MLPTSGWVHFCDRELDLPTAAHAMETDEAILESGDLYPGITPGWA